MKWKLKNSKAKSSKKVCVIKLNKNNLTGVFMKLSNLGNNEYEYSPDSVGIYRIMHNVDKSSNSIKGCNLVYKLDGEAFLRRLSVADEEITVLSNDSIQSPNYVNEMGMKKKAKYES